MENKIYILKVNGKRVFATSLIVEFDLKQQEFRDSGKEYDVEHEELNNADHIKLIRECSKNIIELNRKNNSIKMDLKEN